MSKDPYDTGLRTSTIMWELLSKLLEGEKLPTSLSKAIHALHKGEAYIVMRDTEDEQRP